MNLDPRKSAACCWAKFGETGHGYWLHPAYTGRGLVTAAVATLVGQAFALPDIDRVEIVHDAANTASGGVPRRLGFTEIERRTRAQGAVAPGEVGIEMVWRLTRP